MNRVETNQYKLSPAGNCKPIINVIIGKITNICLFIISVMSGESVFAVARILLS